MTGPEIWLAASLAIPLAGALMIALSGDWPNFRDAISLLSASGLFAANVMLLLSTDHAGTLALVLFLPGAPLVLKIEPLGLMFGLLASGLWIVTTLYSIGYMRANNEANQTRFFACFALALASTMGVAHGGNLITLFVFYEALSLTTYPLVTHHGTPEARRAGRLYLGLLVGASIALFLFALLWTWAVAGTLDFRSGGILADKASAGVLSVLLLLFVFGVAKAAVMPLHRWLPAAMVAPAPVSALLHAVAVVKAGVFTLLKIAVYIFGLDLLATLDARDIVLAMTGFTILAASIVALREDNLKRRLAYSTVSQLSYIVMATIVASPFAVAGAGAHLVSHAFGKITLFFCAGAIYTATHKEKVSELNGLGQRMPWTMGAFALGSLAVIGLPPTAGFLSKWTMFQGAIAAGDYALPIVLGLGTLLGAGYLLPVIYRAFFLPPARSGLAAADEAPLPMRVALLVTAAGGIVLFLMPDLLTVLPLEAIRGRP